MDVSTAAEIKAELQGLIASGHSRLVLNLRDLEFIDSAGLGVLVGCLRRCVAMGGDLCLAEVPALVLSVLELTRLTRVFQVAASESEADQLISQGAAQ
jgi:anti-sigma B factor antagonist